MELSYCTALLDWVPHASRAASPVGAPLIPRLLGASGAKEKFNVNLGKQSCLGAVVRQQFTLLAVKPTHLARMRTPFVRGPATPTVGHPSVC